MNLSSVNSAKCLSSRQRLPFAAFAALAVLAGFWLSSCGSSAPTRGVVVRDDALPAAIEAGMAVAPLTALDARYREADVAARMTEELYATLFASGGGPLIPPDDVHGILEAGNAANRQFFEGFRSRIAKGDRPPADDFVRLSRIVQHRFLFLSWYDESTSAGVETGAGDYREPGFADGVTNTSFAQVIGSIEAMVLDLWEGAVVWHAIEAYRTDRLYGERGSVDAEIERARVDAAARIAALLERS